MDRKNSSGIDKENALTDLKNECGFNLKFYDNKSKEALEKDYSQGPAMLPRGLFLKPIRNALKAQGYATNEQAGIGQLLAMYVKGQQQFYDSTRIYSDDRAEGVQLLLDGKNDWTSATQAVTNEIQELEAKKVAQRNKELDEAGFERLMGLKSIKQRASKNERTLRYVKSGDQAMLLMVQQLCEQKEDFELDKEELKLEKIAGPKSEGNLLDTPVKMTIQIGKYRVVDKLPIKRYGDFRRFFKDKRIAQLLPYLPEDKEVNRQALIKELDYYDRYRIDFFKAVLDFEEELKNRFPEEWATLTKKVAALSTTASSWIIYINWIPKVLTYLRWILKVKRRYCWRFAINFRTTKFR